MPVYDTGEGENIANPLFSRILWYEGSEKYHKTQNIQPFMIWSEPLKLDKLRGFTCDIVLKLNSGNLMRLGNLTAKLPILTHVISKRNHAPPHLKPCDLEAESCKINHLTISELKVEFRPECPQTMHSTNGRLLRGTKTDRFKSENHQEASYGIPEVF